MPPSLRTTARVGSIVLRTDTAIPVRYAGQRERVLRILRRWEWAPEDVPGPDDRRGPAARPA